MSKGSGGTRKSVSKTVSLDEYIEGQVLPTSNVGITLSRLMRENGIKQFKEYIGKSLAPDPKRVQKLKQITMETIADFKARYNIGGKLENLSIEGKSARDMEMAAYNDKGALRVTYNKGAHGVGDRNLRGTIIHEMAHAMVGQNLQHLQPSAKIEVQKLYTSYKSSLGRTAKSVYGAESASEFISESYRKALTGKSMRIEEKSVVRLVDGYFKKK